MTQSRVELCIIRLAVFLAVALALAQQPVTRQAEFTGKVIDSKGVGIPGILVRPLIGTQRGDKRGFERYSGAFTDDSGSFHVKVPVSDNPAEMYLIANEYDGEEPPSENPRFVRTFYPGAVDRAGATPIKLKPGFHFGFDIHLLSIATHRIRGEASGALPGDGSMPRYVYLLVPDDEAFFRGSHTFRVKQDRTFEISGVQPGTYQVQAIQGGQWPDIHRCSPLIRVQAADVSGIRMKCSRAWE
jgi:hypothetical protein